MSHLPQSLVRPRPAPRFLLFLDGAILLGTATANPAGARTITVGPLAQGVNSLTATAANSVGSSAASAPLVVTIDTTPPAAPQFDLDTNSDTAPIRRPCDDIVSG